MIKNQVRKKLRRVYNMASGSVVQNVKHSTVHTAMAELAQSSYFGSHLVVFGNEHRKDRSLASV